MYHSHLLINVGDNPDRPDWDISRRWLRNLYRVHQRLCMAFPSSLTADEERESVYCRPFDYKDFPHQQQLPTESNGGGVHQPRNGEVGFLFRIDYPVNHEVGGRRPVIIVQSKTDNPPDWDYAFGLTKDAVDDLDRPIGNAGFLLAGPPQCKPVSIDVDGDALLLFSEKQDYRVHPGDLVRFRLRANPTRKVQDGSRNGKRKRIDSTGKDYESWVKEHENWLIQKLGDAAESPVAIENFVTGWAYGWRTKYEPQPNQKMQWWSVLFEGTFRLKDPTELKKLLESGIGPAKAFGFGLLSIAPVNS
jgi:hypothetical protein